MSDDQGRDYQNYELSNSVILCWAWSNSHILGSENAIFPFPFFSTLGQESDKLSIQ